MAEPHDFEFQLGRNRALRGRGWRGLLALSLLLIACVATATGISYRVVAPTEPGQLSIHRFLGRFSSEPLTEECSALVT